MHKDQDSKACLLFSVSWVKVFCTKFQLPFALVIDETEDNLISGDVTKIGDRKFVCFA